MRSCSSRPERHRLDQARAWENAPSLLPSSSPHRFVIVFLVSGLCPLLRVLNRIILRVIVLVHVACLVLTIHGLAAHATVVFFFSYTTCLVFLLTRCVRHEASGVPFCARVAMISGTPLVGLGQADGATRAGILLGMQEHRMHANKQLGEEEGELHCNAGSEELEHLGF